MQKTFTVQCGSNSRIKLDIILLIRNLNNIIYRTIDTAQTQQRLSKNQQKISIDIAIIPMVNTTNITTIGYAYNKIPLFICKRGRVGSSSSLTDFEKLDA